MLIDMNKIPIVELPPGLVQDQIICLMKFGSHLYGTNTVDSDTDYKGIYMPTTRQILLGQVPKSISPPKVKKEEGVKNSASDIDMEIYSLPYFLELAMKGETVAVDMLHAPLTWCEISSTTWAYLVDHRSEFYTSNLSALVSYSRKQAAKYGIKGSRLADLELVINNLEACDPSIQLGDVWENLPEGEHIHKVTDSKGMWMYQVCGKKFQETAKVGYVLPILVKTYESYGERAQLAKANKGIDWKAVSHALRFAKQISLIFQRGGFEFPLFSAPYLKAVKQGELLWEDVQIALEHIIKHCEKLAEESDLPDHVDRDKWYDWLEKTMLDEVLGNG